MNVDVLGSLGAFSRETEEAEEVEEEEEEEETRERGLRAGARLSVVRNDSYLDVGLTSAVVEDVVSRALVASSALAWVEGERSTDSK